MVMAMFGCAFYNLLSPPGFEFEDDATPFVNFEHIVVSVVGMVLGDFETAWFTDTSPSK